MRPLSNFKRLFLKIALLSALVLLVAVPAGTREILFLALPAFVSHGDRESGPDPGPGPGDEVIPTPGNNDYVVIAWNDLGMHCMDESFADFAVLPPYNTLVAQVIRRGPEPKIVTDNLRVEYRFLDNSRSDTKTDFWQYVKQLFGVTLAPNIGLTGNGLQGIMRAEQDHFIAEGIPLTPYLDSDPTRLAPYQIAEIQVRDSQGTLLAVTRTVAPVSTEMRCDTCHGDGGSANPSIATGVVKQNILTLHDQEENTTLMANRPVLCAECHASNALGKPGRPGIPSLSAAIHKKHEKIDDHTMAGTCYKCHPGEQTKCLRGIMFQNGQSCQNCHGNLQDIAQETRRPWIDEPRCGNCHDQAHSEQPGTLYRFSRGHHDIFCQACHGSQHAIYPTVIPEDNIQSNLLQGHSGTINSCQVCHTNDPEFNEGPHNGDEGDEGDDD